MFASSMLALVASASLIGAAPLAVPAMDPPGDPQHIGFMFNPCGSVSAWSLPADITIVFTGNTVGTANLYEGAWDNVIETVPVYQVIILPDGGGRAIHAEVAVASTTEPIAPGTRIRNVQNARGKWYWPQVAFVGCSTPDDEWAILEDSGFLAEGDAD